MDLMTIITSVGSLIGTLSVWEMVKYFLNRKTNKRKEEAEADGAELAVIRETIEFLQSQLKTEVERYADQTERLRKTQDENYRLLRENSLLKVSQAQNGCQPVSEDANLEN